jgi:glycosyltransferase involved in cell wall biosynthesis
LTTVALVHDYLTQRGGAERVVLSILKAFPDSPLYTSLYLRDGTFPEFHGADIRLTQLDRFGPFRRNHRLAAPLMALAFSRLELDADVVICSSSGWAHGIQAAGRKIVYCHTPARWLYQEDRYFGRHRSLARGSLHVVRPFLIRWDQKAARSAQRYLTQSTAVRDRIRLHYGIEAEVLPAPYALGTGRTTPVAGIEPGFFLAVSRLLPYKNIDAIIAAFSRLKGYRLVVAGTGPERDSLRKQAGENVQLLGVVSDEQLRWLYANSAGLLAAGFEDYGLTPLEAAAHGKPTAALRWGGFLDTVIEGVTGVFFDSPTAASICDAVQALAHYPFRSAAIRAHASGYSEELFVGRLRAIAASKMPRSANGLERAKEPAQAVIN